jgi:GNAT superfamily N-acetyltransferase
MPQDIQILPIAEEHIEGFHKCLDVVARERQYLALVQAPPLDSTRASVLFNIANHVPRFVAVISNDIVGWCDIFPLKHEGFQHRGELGMGVHPHYRGLGIGQQLANRTIQQARANGLERIELEVFA